MAIREGLNQWIVLYLFRKKSLRFFARYSVNMFSYG